MVARRSKHNEHDAEDQRRRLDDHRHNHQEEEEEDIGHQREQNCCKGCFARLFKLPNKPTSVSSSTATNSTTLSGDKTDHDDITDDESNVIDSRRSSEIKIADQDDDVERGGGGKYNTSSSSSSTNGSSMCGPLPWSWLPIFAGVVPIIGLAITYAIAKTSCHVEKWIFPYVSYTGTRFPELMYFGLLLNLEGFFGMVIVFLAWRYYRYVGGERSTLNNLTLIVGSISCFGVVIVGNFPVTYSKIPHYCGAALAFFLGTGYTILTAVLSCRTSHRSRLPKIHRIKICRIFLALVMTLALGSLIGFAVIKSNQEKNEKPINEENLIRMNPDGSCPHYPNSTRMMDLFGSLTEWVLTLGILICLSLYSYEFKTFDSVKIVLKSNKCVVESTAPVRKKPSDVADDDEEKDDVTDSKADVMTVMASDVKMATT